MKYKYIISLFLPGILVYLLAVWSKITHQAYANLILLIAFGVMALGVLISMIKILRTKNKDSFLNK